MEAFIGLLFLFGIIFAVLKVGGSADHDDSDNNYRPSQQNVKPSVASGHSPQSVQSVRFDAESSKKLPEKRVLIGAAFVTDGDTIRVKNTQIRLFGIDAPELNHPYGKKAKWALHRLCKGETIRAEITDEDQYGRTVARCYLADGRDLSAEMVKIGLAIDWPKYSGGIYKNLETDEVRKRACNWRTRPRWLLARETALARRLPHGLLKKARGSS